MRWDAGRLADFAAQAGFAGEALTEAVALALTVSGGDDHWQWDGASPGAVIAVGLYGIAPAFVPDLSVTDLYDPRANSQVAHRLWKAYGNAFGWSRSFGTAAYAANIDTARSASSSLARPTATAQAGPFGDAAGLAKAIAQGGRAAVAFLGDAGAALRRLGN